MATTYRPIGYAEMTGPQIVELLAHLDGVLLDEEISESEAAERIWEGLPEWASDLSHVDITQLIVRIARTAEHCGYSGGVVDTQAQWAEWIRDTAPLGRSKSLLRPSWRSCREKA